MYFHHEALRKDFSINRGKCEEYTVWGGARCSFCQYVRITRHYYSVGNGKEKHRTTQTLSGTPSNLNRRPRKTISQGGNLRIHRAVWQNERAAVSEILLEEPQFITCKRPNAEVKQPSGLGNKKNHAFKRLVKRTKENFSWWNRNWSLSHKTTLSVRRKLGTAHYPSNSTPTVKHGGGNVMLLKGFSTEGTGRRVGKEGTMNGAEWTIFSENLSQNAKNPGWAATTSIQSAKCSVEGFQKNTAKVSWKPSREKN